MAGELELVAVQVGGGGGGGAPEKVTNVGAAGFKVMAAALRLCQRHLRRTSIMREGIFY